MRTAFISCGALAAEVSATIRAHGWDATVLAIPAILHNHPERIVDAVVRRIAEAKVRFEKIVVVYGDCGTGGLLDKALEPLGIMRVPGPHCYAMFGGERFDSLMEEEPGSYFLTDFLLKSFEPLVIKELGLDRYPELLCEYFRNYKRVVYLAQRPDPELQKRAKEVSEYLKLPLEVYYTGSAALQSDLVQLTENRGD